MKKSALLLCCLFISPCSLAKVFKCTDEQGNVTYTNTQCPHSDASSQSVEAIKVQVDTPSSGSKIVYKDITISDVPQTALIENLAFLENLQDISNTCRIALKVGTNDRMQKCLRFHQYDEAFAKVAGSMAEMLEDTEFYAANRFEFDQGLRYAKTIQRNQQYALNYYKSF